MSVVCTAIKITINTTKVNACLIISFDRLRIVTSQINLLQATHNTFTGGGCRLKTQGTMSGEQDSKVK